MVPLFTDEKVGSERFSLWLRVPQAAGKWEIRHREPKRPPYRPGRCPCREHPKMGVGLVDITRYPPGPAQAGCPRGAPGVQGVGESRPEPGWGCVAVLGA